MSKEIKTLQKIITDQCANYCTEYNGHKNFCISKDVTCRYFTDNKNLPRCRYFEESVLPAEQNKAALVMYNAVLEAQGAGDKLNNTKVRSILQREENRNTISCEKCGDRFKPKSNRQKYCDKCKKAINREQSRLRKQNQRKAV